MGSARDSTTKFKLVLGVMLSVLLLSVVMCVPKAHAQTSEPDGAAIAVEQADQESQEALLAQMLSEYLTPEAEPSTLEEAAPVPDGSSDPVESKEAESSEPAVEGSVPEVQAGEGTASVKSLKATAEEELVPVTTNSKAKTYKVSICKYETGTETFVPGAKLILSKKERNNHWNVVRNGTWTTGSTCKTFQLENGDYKLVEKIVPKGYKQADPVTFTVKNGKVYQGNSNRCATQTVVMYDDPITVSVNVQKVNEEGAFLEGAELGIYMGGETLIHSWTSGSGVEMVSGLIPDTSYELTEISPPDGYEPAGSIIFEVDSNGNLSTESQSQYVIVDGILTMTDIKIPEPQDYYVSKLDGFTGEFVPGATLSVFSYEMQSGDTGDQALAPALVETWVTDGSSHLVQGVVAGGYYYIMEDSVPEGYEQADPVYFAVDSDGVLSVESPGSMESNTVIVEDYPIPGVPEVLKVDDSGNPLAGAQLEVYYANPETQANSGDLADSWTSTTEPHVLEGVEYGGFFVLTEVSAPTGYNPASDIYFEIDENGDITGADAYLVGGILNMVDTEIPDDDPDDPDDRDRTASVTTIKIDSETGEGLAGAQLAIYMLDSNGEITGSAIDSWTSTTSVHITKGLETSEDYIVVETSAPTGYEVGSDITFSVTNSGSVLASASDKDDNGNLAMGNTPADEEIPAEGEETDVVTPDEEVAAEGDVVVPAQASPVVIPRKVVIPKTGDETNAAAALILLAGAMTVFLGAGFALRKK